MGVVSTPQWLQLLGGLLYSYMFPYESDTSYLGGFDCLFLGCNLDKDIRFQGWGPQHA